MKWSLVLQLFLEFIGLAKKKAREFEQEDAQDEHKKIEDDPAGWIGDNFGRVRDSSSVPDDAKGSDSSSSED